MVAMVFGNIFISNAQDDSKDYKWRKMLC